VKLELRRGEDYTLVSTHPEYSAYAPEKLSMERSETAFTPEDRIGALEIQNISVADNRALLLQYAKGFAQLKDSSTSVLGELLSGKNELPSEKK
jgi:argininosuccinate synthase